MAVANFVTAAVDSADPKIKTSCMVILEETDPGVFDRGAPTLKQVHQLSNTHDPIFSLTVPASRIIGGYTTQDGVIVEDKGIETLAEIMVRAEEAYGEDSIETAEYWFAKATITNANYADLFTGDKDLDEKFVFANTEFKTFINNENFRKAMKSIGSTYGGKGKPIIMTEFCNMLDKTREEDMVGLAHIMQVGFTDGQLGGYIAWELFWGEGRGQLIGVCAKNWGSCKNDSIVIGPEYHAMRHYSKFVNPGWKAIAASTTENDLKTVAFASASGDSVSVVVINTGKTAIQLGAPAISGMNVATAVQSKENGFKSKNITIASCYMLPARSVTTLVLTRTAAAPTVTVCQDETTDPNYSEPVITPSADVVIIDYSKTTDVSTWQAISDDLGAVTYNSGALDGVTGYVSVPLAGCEQADCGYKSQLLNISEEGAAALANCTELVITMRSQDNSNAYVNVGAANGGSWVDYQYGRPAAAGKWSETTVDLEKEGDNGSTALTFNSDATGIYIAKIVATGCSSSGIIKAPKFVFNDRNMPAQVFDLNGNLVWSGIKGQALNADGTLRLELRQGMYLVKTKTTTVKAVKK
nr:glycoside hydrolase family 30 beta sandwich domain-containing protein [uncultured Fibrobacter sp.]